MSAEKHNDSKCRTCGGTGFISNDLPCSCNPQPKERPHPARSSLPDSKIAEAIGWLRQATKHAEEALAAWTDGTALPRPNAPAMWERHLESARILGGARNMVCVALDLLEDANEQAWKLAEAEREEEEGHR